MDDLKKLQNTSIFVVGDVLLDEYIIGKVTRISPEAPVPILLETSRRHVLGGAANVAANIAKFGGKAFLCGRIGTDVSAGKVKTICKKLKINTTYLLNFKAIPTITKTRVLANCQQMIRLDNEVCTPVSEIIQYRICTFFEEFLSSEGNKALVISDYAKGMLPKKLVQELVNRANNADIPVISDPKSTDISRYAGSTVIKPNLKDGQDILKVMIPDYISCGFQADVKMMADCFLEQGAENVILSMSENGVFVQGLQCQNPTFIKSFAENVVDVSGAGDTMVAFLAMGLAAKLPLSETAIIASKAAGIVCGKLGTETIELLELQPK